jgi:hypothetical protein
MYFMNSVASAMIRVSVNACTNQPINKIDIREKNKTKIHSIP